MTEFHHIPPPPQASSTQRAVLIGLRVVTIILCVGGTVAYLIGFIAICFLFGGESGERLDPDVLYPGGAFLLGGLVSICVASLMCSVAILTGGRRVQVEGRQQVLWVVAGLLRDTLLVCGVAGAFSGVLIVAFPFFTEGRLTATYMFSFSIPLIVLAIVAGRWLRRITRSAAGREAAPTADTGTHTNPENGARSKGP